MTRLVPVFLMALTACVADVDDAPGGALSVAQAPLPQALDLQVFGSNAGQPLLFSVNFAQPGTQIRIVRAVNGTVGPGPCPPVLGGRCLDIDGAIEVFPFTLTADTTGSASRTLTLPSTVADGTNVAFQAVAPSGPVGSNPVLFTTAPP